MIVIILKIIAKLFFFTVAVYWMRKSGVPFWSQLGIGTLIIIGATIEI